MNLRLICAFCAICLFIAVLNLPIGYYTFLRFIVTIGAVLVMIKGRKHILNFSILIFAAISLLYNPIIPIYLYEKSIWIPIDIITGILFLLIRFEEIKPDNKEDDVASGNSKNYQRDKIIQTNYKKNLKQK